VEQEGRRVSGTEIFVCVLALWSLLASFAAIEFWNDSRQSQRLIEIYKFDAKSWRERYFDCNEMFLRLAKLMELSKEREPKK